MKGASGWLPPGKTFFRQAADKTDKKKAPPMIVTGTSIVPRAGNQGALPGGVGPIHRESSIHITHLDPKCDDRKESDCAASSLSHLEAMVSEKLGRPATSEEVLFAKKVEDFLSEYQPESKRDSPMAWVTVGPKPRSKEVTIWFNTAKLADQLSVDSEYVSTVLGSRRPWSSPTLFNGPLREISDSLVRDMSNQYHHTPVHGLIMSNFAAKSMKETVGENPFLEKLASVIGAAHDIVQSSGTKNNEFESAHKVMEMLSKLRGYQGLGPDQKGAVLRLVCHTICCYTTLDFSWLKTYGEIVQSETPLERGAGQLETFGQKIAHNDLFSKIEYFGNRRAYERAVPGHHAMSDSQYFSSGLLTQMVQMSLEFNVPAVAPILDLIRSSDVEISAVGKAVLKTALQQMVLGETLTKEDADTTRKFPGFWRAGMPPCDEMMRLLGEGDSLPEKLLRDLEDPKFLDNTLRLIKATTVNASFSELSRRFDVR